jgi:D-amino peptidase
MRVYVSVDMEGVAGVVHGDQTRRGQSEFATACQLMTAEANAAVLGAFDGGADEVLVNDSHGDMRNLVLDQLDPRVEVITGSLKPLSMAEGIDIGRFDVALFVGYHGGAGTTGAILDHTYRGVAVYELRVNGRVVNEAALNAMVLGSRGIPVGLVTGDESTCTQCRELLGDVETVVVKWAIGRLAARTIHPELARRRIREAAARVVADHRRFQPFAVAGPVRIEMDTVTTAVADAAAVVPGAVRTGPRTIAFEADDADTAFRAMIALVRLGGTAA